MPRFACGVDFSGGGIMLSLDLGRFSVGFCRVAGLGFGGLGAVDSGLGCAVGCLVCCAVT